MVIMTAKDSLSRTLRFGYWKYDIRGASDSWLRFGFRAHAGLEKKCSTSNTNADAPATNIGKPDHDHLAASETHDPPHGCAKSAGRLRAGLLNIRYGQTGLKKNPLYRVLGRMSRPLFDPWSQTRPENLVCDYG